MKKYIFLAALTLAAATGLTAGWAAFSGALALLMAWLVYETRQRTRIRFFDRACRERSLRFASEPHAVLCSTFDPCVLFIEEHRRFSLFEHSSGALMGSFDVAAPRAAALGPGLRLAVAEDDALLLYDLQGRVQARQPFEPPLQRQSYHLTYSADGSGLALHTPWFVELFPSDLSSPGLRLRYEAAGHYLKYCALSPDASRLMTAGALLLDDDQGLEARWDFWQRTDLGWSPLRKEARESSGNSHLRGVGFSRQGGWAWAELYQDGYEFILYDAAGEQHWRRVGGERPVLDPGGSYVLFEGAVLGVALADLPGKTQIWVRPVVAPLRYKSVSPDGQCLLLEGGSFMMLRADGSEGWRQHLRVRDDAFSTDGQGRFAFISQDRAALLSLPWRSGT